MNKLNESDFKNTNVSQIESFQQDPVWVEIIRVLMARKEDIRDELESGIIAMNEKQSRFLQIQEIAYRQGEALSLNWLIKMLDIIKSIKLEGVNNDE